ncbi:hypothetical protein [Limnoglobus roseus]|uniref:Uncharacterized protein n=1 Tax=Limnoglobus roseus TaxID=2598579 RepID=A0A5C1AMR2_9BACT|nr:hypothetical protein [Limnoglobus roseus]QEL19427.1 hypothetical protein PX52LOC_06499 [Limnoglobus roseus]
MRITLRSLTGCAGLGLALSVLSGCQTYFGGLTLPSPHYLKQRPQYFPPDPAFPLQREVDSMQDPDGLLRRNAGAVAPVIAPAAPVAAPAPAGAGR